MFNPIYSYTQPNLAAREIAEEGKVKRERYHHAPLATCPPARLA